MIRSGLKARICLLGLGNVGVFWLRSKWSKDLKPFYGLHRLPADDANQILDENLTFLVKYALEAPSRVPSTRVSIIHFLGAP